MTHAMSMLSGRLRLSTVFATLEKSAAGAGGQEHYTLECRGGPIQRRK